MMSTVSMRQPENWLYEIWQKGYDSPCYVMVPNAKDLVKSHLMIAVREEVEVLKERISELMDKINQLEVENTILKANISQETLQQLQLQTQLQIAGSASSTAAAAGNNMLTAPPSSTTVSSVTTSTAQTVVSATNAASTNVSESTTTAAVENVNVTASANVNSSTAPPTTAAVNANSDANATTAAAATASATASTVSNNATTNGPMP